MNKLPYLETLLEEIRESGYSTRRVSLHANIDPATVSRWKTGRTEPRLSSLARLHSALLSLRGGEE